MGKTTLYHPVSLHVVRGAAEYCGWKFKTLKQTGQWPEIGRAHYQAVIEKIPKESTNKSLAEMKKALNACFAADITVTLLWKTKNGTWKCNLTVDTNSGQMTWEDALSEAYQSGMDA